MAVWLHVFIRSLLVYVRCIVRELVTLISSHRTLSDEGDGDHTETCWSYCNFNANFDTPLKTIIVCISW